VSHNSTRRPFIAILLAAVANIAVASPAMPSSPASAVASPYDNRIRTFTYSPEVVYNLHCAVGMTTQIALEPGEGLIEDPHIGDSIQWRVSGGPTNIYIKPVRPDLTTSLSLVTNKRIYQFQLFSGPVSNYEQMVSFRYPQDEMRLRLREKQAQEEAQQRQATEVAQKSSQLVSMKLNPTDLAFNYTVKGDAPFRPENVFDDGRFTYLLMPHLQDLPAAFLVDPQGQLTLVNYIHRGSYLVIERVASHIVLKLGKQQIDITRIGGERE
jgi:type IV secretion system protein VirB9